MWLVERVTDYEYEGEVRTALFVTTNETMARDFCVAAVIEAEAGATIKRPARFHAFEGMMKKDGSIYSKADWDAEDDVWREKLRTIVTLDKMDDEALERLSMYSYECQEVEVR